MYENYWIVDVDGMSLKASTCPYWPGSHDVSDIRLSCFAFNKLCCDGRMTNEQSLRIVRAYEMADAIPENTYATVVYNLGRT